MLTNREIETLRDLARQYAEIAALPVHAEKRKLWTDNNEFRSARPMVLIDQVCWNEMDPDGALKPEIGDEYWRRVETELKRKLYSWRHMPVDMVFDPYLSLPKPFTNTGWGMENEADRMRIDPTGNVYSQKYHNQIRDFDDLERIRMPEITLDAEKLRAIREQADFLFGGILPYRMEGHNLQLGVWDSISTWMGVDNCYIELIDRPELIHALMEKLTQGLIHQIEALNRQGLYNVTSHIVHCSHTYLDNLPAKDSDPDFGTSQNGWGYGQAQLFTSVAPEITDEFEVEYMRRVHPYFGAIYYGCCERLDDRMEFLAKLDRVRKISCSPWSNRERFAENMPPRRVMSAKPNPAFLATDSFHEENVRKDLRATIDAAKRYGRNLEFLLKDISTVRYDPPRLWRWAEIAMEEVQR